MEAFIIAVIIAATPFLYAATGELVAERSGVLNLGVEGMMLLGAVAAFAVALTTGSSVMGIAAGAGAGAAGALLFAIIALGFTANQAATGLALTIFGGGASGLIGQGYVGTALPPLPKMAVPEELTEFAAARILLSHDGMVFGAFALVFLTWCYLRFTRSGLRLHAIGDDHDSAQAQGLAVLRVRTLAVLFGGACAGLGGAYLSLAYTPLWAEDMTAGRGWIAVALVVFATWRLFRVAIGALIFAAFDQAGNYRETLNIDISSQFLSMAPYIATIIALVVISIASRRSDAPASLGKDFRPDR
jgi:simple sugar transport system permease protein